jgi:hypothetical protein
MEVSSFVVVPMLMAMLTPFARPELTVFFLLSLFVANAAGTIAIGGVGIPPADLFLLVYCIRILSTKYGPRLVVQAVSPWGAGFTLCLLVTYGLFTAFFYPRLLQDVTEVIYTDRSVSEVLMGIPRPLAPGSGNITQSFHFVGGACAFAATYAYVKIARTPIFLWSFAALAGLNIIFGVLDILTYNLGISYVLDFIRSGGYLVMIDQDFGTFRRVVGSFPEPSTFAAFSFVMFAAMFVMWLHGWGSYWVAFLLIANLMMIIFSTSTTGYAALAVFLIVVPVWLAVAFLSGRFVQKAMTVAWVLCFAAAVGIVLLLLDLVPNSVYEVVNLTLHKEESLSGMERSMTNVQAWNNFLDTYGLGVGLGSARASGFAYVLLSNMGIIGFLGFSIFLMQLLGPVQAVAGRDARTTVAVAKSQIITILLVSIISGGIFDLGLLFYVACAVVTGLQTVTAADRTVARYA